MAAKLNTSACVHSLDETGELVGQPSPDLLRPLRRIVLVVIEVALAEPQLRGEIEADYMLLPTHLQGGPVETSEGPSPIDTVGTRGGHDAGEASALQPIVGPGLRDKHRHLAQARDQPRNAFQSTLVSSEVDLQLRGRPYGMRGLICPVRCGKVLGAMAQVGAIRLDHPRHGGPQEHESASLLDFPPKI